MATHQLFITYIMCSSISCLWWNRITHNKRVWPCTWSPGERSLSCLTMMSIRTLASLVYSRFAVLWHE